MNVSAIVVAAFLARYRGRQRVKFQIVLSTSIREPVRFALAFAALAPPTLPFNAHDRRPRPPPQTPVHRGHAQKQKNRRLGFAGCRDGSDGSLIEMLGNERSKPGAPRIACAWQREVDEGDRN